MNEKIPEEAIKREFEMDIKSREGLTRDVMLEEIKQESNLPEEKFNMLIRKTEDHENKVLNLLTEGGVVFVSTGEILTEEEDQEERKEQEEMNDAKEVKYELIKLVEQGLEARQIKATKLDRRLFVIKKKTFRFILDDLQQGKSTTDEVSSAKISALIIELLDRTAGSPDSTTFLLVVPSPFLSGDDRYKSRIKDELTKALTARFKDILLEKFKGDFTFITGNQKTNLSTRITSLAIKRFIQTINASEEM